MNWRCMICDECSRPRNLINYTVGNETVVMSRCLLKRSVFGLEVAIVCVMSNRNRRNNKLYIISMINKLEQKFHCIYATDLPLNSFTFKNVDFDVPSIFQIWSHHELINENIRPLYIKILKTMILFYQF